MGKLLLLLVLWSCSHVNQESRDHFYGKKSHGLVVTRSPEDATWKEAIDYKAAKRGKKLFEQNCTNCHGKGAEGDGPKAKDFAVSPKNLKKLAQNAPHFRFYIDASKWSKSMPGWTRDYSQEELDEITHYLRSLTQ